MDKLFIPSVIAISLGLVACKPPQNSKVKSLENFAFGKDVRINACGVAEDQLEARDPRNKVAVFIDVKEASLAKKVSSELILALSAVPDAALRIFQAKNGKVLVTPDVAAICAVGGALKFNGQSPVASSCVLHTPFETTSGKFEQAMSGTTLVVAPDAAAIRHGVVRSMGYMVADALDVDPSFSLLRVELTKAFLTDMTTSSIFTLKAHEGLLGSGIDSIVRNNLADNQSNPLEGANTTSDRVYNFMQLVVGEAFDSYYCRTGGTALFAEDVAERIKEPKDAPLFAYLTDTRLVMSYFFPRTYSAFRLVEAHMEGFAAQFPSPQFRNGAKTTGSDGGFQLAEGNDKDSAFALADGGGQTVDTRASEFEQMIRQNAALTRETFDQWQQKKTAHDGSWTDVWGNKKSEMDAARSSYRFAQGREQALIQELQRVRDEEKRVGAGARTSSDRQFNVPDLKVGTFDANAELAKGVQATAKRYGDNVGQVSSAVNRIQGRGLGFIVGGATSGSFQGGMDGAKMGEEIGAAWGKGIGDGVGGVLGSFGKIGTDSITATGKSITDTQKFANDLAVDPRGTMARKGREYVDSSIARLEGAQQFGRAVYNGDVNTVKTTVDQTLQNTLGVGTLYKTAQNSWAFYNARTPEEAQSAIQRQYDTAGQAISDAGSASFKGVKKSVMQTDRIKYVSDTLTAPRDYLVRVSGVTSASLLAPYVKGSSAVSQALEARDSLKRVWQNANAAVDAAGGKGLNGFSTTPTGAMVKGINSILPKKDEVKTVKPQLGPADGIFFKDTSAVTTSGYAYSPSFKVPSRSGGQGALIPYKTTTTTVGPSTGAYKPTSITVGPSMGGYKPYSSIVGSTSSSYNGSTYSNPIRSYSLPGGYRPSGNSFGSGASYVSPSKSLPSTTQTVSPSSR